MTEANERPPLEDAADAEAEAGSEDERRGEWDRAAQEAQRDPQHQALHKAQERVEATRSRGGDGERSDERSE